MENSRFSFLRSNAVLLSIAFVSGLAVLEFFFFSYVRETFSVSIHYKYGIYSKLFAVMFLALASVFLTGFFVWSGIASPYPYRIVYFLVFCIAVLTEYGYQYAFHRFTVFEDFENAYIGADWNIIGNAVGMYFNFWGIIPCLIYGLLLVFVKPMIKKGWAVLALSFSLLIAFFFFTAYFTHNNFLTVSPSAFFRTAVDFPVRWNFGSVYTAPHRVMYNTRRQEIEYRTSESPKNNIVFIVDESVRGDHLSLNGYDRPTTVFLQELERKKLLMNWGVAVSGTTCSISSNNLLLTGVNELPDSDFKIYKLPSIFQYAKAAGYKTMYIDGQVSKVWFGKPLDAEFIDRKLTIRDFRGLKISEIDGEIARRVRKTLKSSKGNFIWISKAGMHKPYQSAYPREEAEFLPVAESDNSRGFYDLRVSIEATVNDYDNAIRYNSQSFFTNLTGDELPENSIFVYTSDHGQTLRENGATVSHCSDSKSEATVPLFIIAEEKLLADVDTNFKASHSNIFATLLDLMNFPEESRRYDYSISLFKAKNADSQPRFFYSGNIHNQSEGKKILFDE